MLESTTTHTLMGGKLRVYRRERSGCWPCATRVNGKNVRVSTKTDSLAHAKDFAQDWYLELHGKLRRGEAVAETTFKEAAKAFEREYEIITNGERSPHTCAGTRIASGSILIPSSARRDCRPI